MEKPISWLVLSSMSLESDPQPALLLALLSFQGDDGSQRVDVASISGQINTYPVLFKVPPVIVPFGPPTMSFAFPTLLAKPCAL